MKICSCGRVYFVIPKSSIYAPDAICPGYYFNCSCGSTIVIKRKLKAFLLILLASFFVACGESKDQNPYPVASQYQGQSLDSFKSALISYYGVENSFFKFCELLSDLDCNDFYELEDFVKESL